MPKWFAVRYSPGRQNIPSRPLLTVPCRRPLSRRCLSASVRRSLAQNRKPPLFKRPVRRTVTPDRSISVETLCVPLGNTSTFTDVSIINLRLLIAIGKCSPVDNWAVMWVRSDRPLQVLNSIVNLLLDSCVTALVLGNVPTSCWVTPRSSRLVTLRLRSLPSSPK